jgi:hypothetical protein
MMILQIEMKVWMMVLERYAAMDLLLYSSPPQALSVRLPPDTEMPVFERPQLPSIDRKLVSITKRA